MQTRILFFLKGGKGSGNYGHAGIRGIQGGSAHGLPHPHVSAAIQSEPQAIAYWKVKIAGKRWIKTDLPGDLAKIFVLFPRHATHAYTDHVLDAQGNRTKVRQFSLVRARKMDKIVAVIQAPAIALQHGDGHLFLERVERGHHYGIVLKKQQNGEYVFTSAYDFTLEDVAKRLSQSSSVLRKSNAPDSSEASTPFGASASNLSATSTHTGSSRDVNLTVRYVADFIKADLDVWREIFSLGIS